MVAGKSGVRIRPMEVEDVDMILSIDKKITGVQRALTYPDNNLIGGQFSLSFVAEDNNKVIGFVLASLTYVPEEVTEVCVILTIGVDSDYWQQGIATRLIQALLDISHSRGIQKVLVMVDQDDSQLTGFFNKMGFFRGRLVEYYRDV